MMREVKYIVYSSDLEGTSFVKNNKEAAECIPVLDARSAVYVATGICAQNHVPVIVCVNSSNSSRSAFSGMTEAFYRHLPVALITFGKELDYSKELADVVVNHYVVSDEKEIDGLLQNEFPMHIEVLAEGKQIDKLECRKVQDILSAALDSKVYLYIGQGIDFTDNPYRCKTVRGGMPNCYEGALANVLGASFAKKKDRYIGLVTEEEFLHDMNTLGNVHVNESLLFIVVCKKKNDVILNYANALSFKTESMKESDLDENTIRKVVYNIEKALLMIDLER